MTPAAGDAHGQASYRFGPACIAVASDDRDAGRWLREFLTPWFVPGPPDENPLAVRMTSSAPAFAALEQRMAEAPLVPHACFALDRQVVELPGWTEDGELVIADRERGCFYRVQPGGVEIVAQPGERRVRVGLMRVVRELAAARMLRQGGILDLHASAFVIAGRAILLVGPKQSGKTTLLVDALASGRAALLANDRVLVDTRQPPERALGVPTLVSLRTGTLRWFPSLAQGLPNRPALLHAEELKAQRGVASADGAPLQLALSPSQLAGRLGARIAACAPIAAIVFPEISPTTARWTLERVSDEDGAQRLRDGLYGSCAGARPTTVFEAAAPGAEPEPARRLALADQLASRIPLFRCRLGRHAYRDGALAWLQALPLEPAEKACVA